MSTTKELIAEHNQLAEKLNKPTINSWKKSKDALQAIIDDMANETEVSTSTNETEVSTSTNETKVSTSTSEPEVKTPKEKGPTVKETALGLLCRINFYEDKTSDSSDENRVQSDHPHARSVGHTYEEVLSGVKLVFPAAKTSIACLRWYATKVSAGAKGYENYKLPQRRPRG